MRAMIALLGAGTLGAADAKPGASAQVQSLHGWLGQAALLVVAIYLVYLLVPLMVWLIRPRWMFVLATGMRNAAVFGLDKKVNTALLYASFVKPYEYSGRVLDAWVKAQLPHVREKFRLLSTLEKHTPYVPVPITCDGEPMDLTSPEKVQALFRGNSGVVLIAGDGGCGKTSLACHLALQAMELNGPDAQPMIPLLLERGFEPDEGGKKSLAGTAIGRLEGLIDNPKRGTISDELFDNLLRKGRILVIVDGLSEMDDETRKAVTPGSKGFAAKALVVTSRINEPALDPVAKKDLKPDLLKKDAAADFLGKYLTLKEARNRLNEQQFKLVVERFGQLAGKEDSITPLLATLWANEIVTKLDKAPSPGAEQTTVASDIPSLMLNYAAEMHTSRPAGYKQQVVLSWLKAAAWECLKERYSPRPVPRFDVVRAIKDADLDWRRKELEQTTARLETSKLPEELGKIQSSDAQPYFQHLVDIGVLRIVDHEENAEFVLNFLAEYLAGTFLAENYGSVDNDCARIAENAKKMVQEADDSQAALQQMKSFLLAVRDCCQVNLQKRKIPQSLVNELGELAGEKSLHDLCEYYANYVRRFGIPEGIGEPLSESDAHSRQCVKITKRNGRVRRVETVNGAGSPVPQSSVSYLAAAPADKATTQQECQWGFSYDESGNLVLEEALDQAGRLVYRCAYAAAAPRPLADHPAGPAPDAKGDAAPADTQLRILLGSRATTARYYLEPTDIVYPRTRSGAAFARITWNADGFDEGVEYYDGLNRPQPDPNGWFGRRNEVGKLGLPVRVTCLGPDGKPAMSKDGYAISERIYDGCGNPTTESYFDQEAKPVLHAEGYHKVIFDWGQSGNCVLVRYTDASDTPMRCNKGFGGWKATYDAYGTITGQTYLDAAPPGVEAKPVVIKDGYAAWKGECDPRGNLTQISFSDAAGEACTNQDGIAGWTASYDSAGNCKEVKFRGLDGNVARDKSGVAGFLRTFDERGQIKETYFLGPDGKPAWHKEGYAGWQNAYDDKGNCTKTSYLDTNRKPAYTRQGYAITGSEYDDRGNQTAESYFDPAGNPTEDKNGRHRIVYEYDQHGNCVLTSFFDADGSPALYEGYASRRARFDESGHIREEVYLDSSERLTWHENGYAIARWLYDARGNQVQGTFLDPDRNLVETAQSIAGWRKDYDDRGYNKGQVFFDAQGKIAAGPDGYAQWVAAYDERGNTIELQYADRQGRLVSNANGVAWWKAEYDPCGRRRVTLYFDADGKPALNKEGSAGWAALYDRLGNQIELQYIDPKRNLMLRNNGVARITWVYDDCRNQKTETYWGLEKDKLVTGENGYASWRAEFDERGNRTLREFLDGNGASIKNKNGFVKEAVDYDDLCRVKETVRSTPDNEKYRTSITYGARGERTEEYTNPYEQISRQYDKFGNQLSEAYFDANRQPKITRSKALVWSRWSAEYDQFGRLKTQVYRDTGGVLLQAVAFERDIRGRELAKVVEELQDDCRRQTRTDHEADGEKIQVLLLDKARIPIADMDGRSRWVEKFDARGNRVLVAYFDTAGKPVPYRGHYRSLARFDGTSQLVEVSYFIPQGETDILQRTFRFVPGELPHVTFESWQADSSRSSNEAYVLQYMMRPDEECRYAIVSPDSDGTPQRRKMRQVCDTVNDDGTYGVTVYLYDDNADWKSEPKSKMQMRMARTGEVLQSDGAPTTQVPFPTHPVFVGETWRKDVASQQENPYTDQSEAVRLVYTYTLSEIEDRDGKRLAHIQVHCPTNEFALAGDATQKITARGETLFAVEEGILVKSDVESEVVITVGGVEEVRTKANVSVELQPQTATVSGA